MRRNLFVLSTVFALVGCVAAVASEPADLLARASDLYEPPAGPFDFAAYEARLREAIALYEEALPLIADGDTAARLSTLHRLARAWFELGKAYLPKGADQKAAFAAGRDHALASLRLDPEFTAREAKGFRDALANASNVESVFWYGTTTGMYINYDLFTALFGGGMQDVRACYERAAELDEAFLAAAPLRSLASYLAQVPASFGGDLSRARELFERAIALAPEFLENSSALAQWVLKPTRDPSLCAVVADVQARGADPAVMGAWPLYNTLALADAAKLAEACP